MASRLIINFPIKLLEEVSEITRLAGAEYSDVWEEDSNGEIIALRGFNIGQNKIIERDFVKITNELSLKLNRSRLYKNDVVYPCVGTIGNAVAIKEDNKYHIQQNIAKITPKPDVLDSDYLAYFLMSPLATKEVLMFNATTSQPNVLVGSLRKYKIPVPKISIQRKITKILSTWDSAIETLQQLITKKERYKKALMQQLLTGKKRFKEFKGEKWENTPLDKMAVIIMGQSPSSDAYNEDGNGLPLIQGNADIKDRKTTPRIYTSDITKECKIGDIILTVRAPVGAVAKSFHNACIWRGVCVLRANTVDKELLYYLLLEYEPKWKSLEQGSTFTAVNSNDIKNLEFKISTNIKEQNKIASVLSAADEEIQTLKTQLAHYKQQKQGLMQQLLTGKMRVKD